MATREHRGASGELELYYNFEETSSTHEDWGSSAKIVVQDDNTLMLELNEHYNNVYRPRERRVSKEKYSIGVQDLIQLIKRNGKRL